MEFFTKREQIAILSVVVLILGVLGARIVLKEKVPEITDVRSLHEAEAIEDDGENEDIRPKVIMVHISGQVYHPGIFQLIEGDRVVDAVDLAGGLTKQADLDRINLAKKLVDEDKIYIPSYQEEVAIETGMNTSTGGGGLLDINSCSQQELESLPGIGEVIAGRVVEYREKNKFKRPEDIMNVSGIGDAKFEQIKDLITVN
ncbi:helix-hairpin-helix domain-containing protein [Gudongella sp. SC589]|jgi:competence protein ComEA|uniref:helix-hairpin-helix domain-containing protein n=1 Tax=Gudongella sp. SC589 TaxID=3385990 RepID=UPI003904BA53